MATWFKSSLLVLATVIGGLAFSPSTKASNPDDFVHVKFQPKTFQDISPKKWGEEYPKEVLFDPDRHLVDMDLYLIRDDETDDLFAFVDAKFRVQRTDGSLEDVHVGVTRAESMPTIRYNALNAIAADISQLLRGSDLDTSEPPFPEGGIVFTAIAKSHTYESTDTIASALAKGPLIKSEVTIALPDSFFNRPRSGIPFEARFYHVDLTKDELEHYISYRALIQGLIEVEPMTPDVQRRLEQFVLLAKSTYDCERGLKN